MVLYHLFAIVDIQLLCFPQQVGQVVDVRTAGDIRAAESLRSAFSYVVMDASDWRIIPAENLVAAFQVHAAQT